MAGMSDLAISLGGIQRAELQLDSTASKLARLSTSPNSSSLGGDIVDLSSAAAALMQSRQVAEANIKAFQSMDQVQKSLIDIMG